ncbi:MAG: phosphatidylinositol-3-phosphatase [Actinomycetota bacterium]
MLGASLAIVAVVSSPAPATAAVPGIKHVFIIVMENKNYDETFGPDSPAPYLAKELVAQGLLMKEYYGTSHLSLGNYITMVSGQAPNPQTQADCINYTEFVGVASPLDGQFVGTGCVYPPAALTIADQLEAKSLTWKGYMEDMGTPCRHPALNTTDDTQQAEAGDQYATRHNPFMYFHSIIDDDPQCKARVVDLSALTADLVAESTTPNYSFITPDLCHDGHDDPCVNSAQQGGLAGEDEFLKEWVPRILASPAFKKDGLLIVTYDEAEAAGGSPDASACCAEPTGPNTPLPGITGPGGGRTGSVLLSPFIAPGSVTEIPYNHYSLLRSMEDLFGLEHLGYAAQTGLVAFGADVYTRPQGPPTSAPSPAPAPVATGAGGGLPPTGASTAATGVAAAAVACWLVLRRLRAATRPKL